MKTPKKPVKPASEKFSDEEEELQDSPSKKFVEEDEDDFDLPLDDLGSVDGFSDFDDDDDDF
jgi:hypothetical protein